MTLAVSIIDLAARQLNDDSFTRWSRLELLDWLNAGRIEICTYRPDANTKTVEHAAAHGTRQSLPAEATRLIDVTRNVGGRVITQIRRDVLDQHIPDWHSSPATPASEAEHFCYSVRDPKTFWLYPRVALNTPVEVVYALAPEPITSAQPDLSDIAAEDVGIPATYDNALREYILYCAFSKATQFPGGAQRAQQHYAAFANAMGVKVQSDAAIGSSPQLPDRVPGGTS